MLINKFKKCNILTPLRFAYLGFLFLIPFDHYGIKIASFHISLGDIFLGFIFMLLFSILCMPRISLKIHRFSQADILLLLLVFGAGLLPSILNHSATSFIFTKSILKLLFIYFITILLVNSLNLFDKAVKIILLSALLASCLAILQSFWSVSWINQLGRLLQAREIGRVVLPFQRSAGPYTLYGQYGMWLVSILPGVIISFFTPRYHVVLKNRIWIATSLTILSLGIVVSQTRGIWISAGLVTLGSLLFSLQNKIKRSTFILLTSLLILFLMLPLIIFFSPKIITTFIQIKPSTVYERINIIQVASTIFHKYPIFGIGYSNFLNVASKYGIEKTIHNIFWETLVSTGLVGFIPFLAFLGIISGRAIKVYREKRVASPGYFVAIPLGFMGVMIEAQFIRALYSEELWLIMGLVSTLYFLTHNPRKFKRRGKT